MIRPIQNSALPQMAMQPTEQAQSLQPQLKTATVEGASRPVAGKFSAVMLPRDEFSPSSPKLDTAILPFRDHGPVVNNKPLDLSGAVADLGAGPVQDRPRLDFNPRDLLGPGPAQARPRNTISPGHHFIDHGPVQNHPRLDVNPKDLLIDLGPVKDASAVMPRTHGIQPFSLEDAKNHASPALRDAFQTIRLPQDDSNT